MSEPPSPDPAPDAAHTPGDTTRPDGKRGTRRHENPADRFGAEAQKMLKAFDGVKHPLIVNHDNPDPDSLAGGMIMQAILKHSLGLDAPIGFRGIIGRAENQAFVRHTGVPLTPWDQLDLSKIDGLAMVDTQPNAGNNPIGADVPMLVVIDHHQIREETKASRYWFVDEHLGASSTALGWMARSLGVEFTPELATALFYGIKTETRGLARENSKADRELYTWLFERIDYGALADIQSAPLRREHYTVMAVALRNAVIHRDAAIVHVGEVDQPDITAEVADWLLRCDDLSWVLCTARHNDGIQISLRTSWKKAGAHRIIRETVKDLGRAGGHAMMAGGRAPIDVAAGRDENMLVKALQQNFLVCINAADAPGEPLVPPPSFRKIIGSDR
jgi:nanoRNase/pAp phosphatase (c-di-AMP/oligoRNAs hydrolase)